MAVVVHRHGDRSPIAQTAGTNFNWDSAGDFWRSRLLGEQAKALMAEHHPWLQPFGSMREEWRRAEAGRGQLTAKGAGQLHDLGTSLRLRYVHQAGLLPGLLNPAQIFSRSTAVPRCYQSAASLLLGLYPVERRPSTATKVVIESRDASTETMWEGAHMCPALTMIREFWEAEFGVLHYKAGSEYKEVVDTVIKAFGTTATNPSKLNLMHFGEIVDCFSTHGSEIPGVALPTGFAKMFDRWRDRQFFHKYVHSNTAALGGGRHLIDIASLLETAVITGEAPYKFAQFSCHDTSLIPLMFTLGLMDESSEWPKYGSSLVLELYKRDGDDGTPRYYVMALYNGKAVYIGDSKGLLTPWDTFVRVVESNGLSGFEWTKSCKSK